MPMQYRTRVSHSTDYNRRTVVACAMPNAFTVYSNSGTHRLMNVDNCAELCYTLSTVNSVFSNVMCRVQ